MGEFEGAAVLVTGAATGIGRATAVAFAREGARVAIADVAAEPAEETAAAVRAAGSEALVISADVSDAAAVGRMVAQVVEAFGGLDVAINNAGISGPLSPIVHAAEPDFDQVIGVNLKGVWLCMRAELRVMLEQGHGAIANTASIQGLQGVANMSAYGASKGGVIALTRHVAREVGAAGIRVNCVCPGAIRTPMYERNVTTPEEDRETADMAWLKRVGDPEEVADVFLWVCSPRASYVTGQAIVVDGTG